MPTAIAVLVEQFPELPPTTPFKDPSPTMKVGVVDITIGRVEMPTSPVEAFGTDRGSRLIGS